MFNKIVLLMLLCGSITVAAPTEHKDAKSSIYAAAKQYGVPPKLYYAIIVHESKGHISAYNRRTHDYGVAQIHSTTIRSYGFNKHRLLTDADYALNAGALVLSDIQKQYKHKEPFRWPCFYNIGTRPLTLKRIKLCNSYLSKIGVIK